MRLPLVALVLGLAACASPADKIATRLETAGLPPGQARCMGERLSDRLSIGQLRQLERLAASSAGERLTVGRLAARLSGADPRLVGELLQTGLSCAV